MEHGVLGGVAGGHVVPGIQPLGLVGAVGGGLAGVGQVVPLGDHVAVVAVVVGNGGNAQGLAAGHQVLGQQIVLEVGLVGRVAGLALELLHPAVELGEADRVPLRDQPGHVLGLGLGLEGVVPVQIKAAGGGTGHIGAALHVLLGDDDEEHVVQQLVHIHGLGLDGVVLLQIHHGGDGGGGAVGVLPLEVAQVGGGVGHQVGHGHGALLALGAHLGGQLGLALGGEAGELVVVDGAGVGGGGLHQHPGEGQHAVAGGHLVGVDVGVHHGHLVVAQGAVLNLRNQGGGIALGLGLDLLPLVHRGLALGDDQVGHVQALHAVVALAGAHGELLHIQPGVLRGEVHDGADVLIELLHGVEAVVGSHLHALHGAQGLAVQGGGQVVPAAHVQIGAAVGVGGAGVGGALPGGAVGGVEVDPAVKGDGEIDLAVLGHRAGGDVGEQGGLPVGAQPSVQRAAGGVVGIELRIHIGLALVVVQRPDHAFGGGLGLRLGHVHGDFGLKAAAGGEGDGVCAAVTGGVGKAGCGLCGGALRGGGGDHAQAHQQRQRRHQGQQPAKGRVFLHALHLSSFHASE